MAICDQQKEIWTINENEKGQRTNKLAVIVMTKLQRQAKEPKTYANTSLCCISVENRCRELLLMFVAWPWFDRIVLIVILGNAAMLANENPLDTEHHSVEKGLEMFVMFFYTTEVLVKVFAMGFFLGKYSYLRDPWNIVDFFIVVVTWLSLMNTSMNYSSMRIFRVLRTLRTISAMPTMASLVKTLINLFPAMGNILILFALTILLYATIAMQLFGGVLSGRCVPETKRNDKYWELEKQFWLKDPSDNEIICNEVAKCPGLENLCLIRENPNHGMFNADNLMFACYMVFQIITLEGWSE
jgi:hypothetical protein